MIAEVFTVATRSTLGLERFLNSLSRFGVPITVLGQNEPEYWGHAWRWKTIIKAVKASSANTVIHCDGYDSVCLGPLDEMLTKFRALSHPILFSSEPPEQPEFPLALNPGLMIADRKALLDVFPDRTLDEFFPDHFNDMFQIQSMYGWNPGAFMLDRQGIIFHTLGPRSPELAVQNNKLVNPVTGFSPSFVHAPSRWDLSKVEQWLAAQD